MAVAADRADRQPARDRGGKGLVGLDRDAEAGAAADPGPEAGRADAVNAAGAEVAAAAPERHLAAAAAVAGADEGGDEGSTVALHLAGGGAERDMGGGERRRRRFFFDTGGGAGAEEAIDRSGAGNRVEAATGILAEGVQRVDMDPLFAIGRSCGGGREGA